MNKSRIYIAIIVIVFIAVVGGYYSSSGDSISNSSDYARITKVDYQAKVVDEPDSEGKVIITERLTFDIHALSEDNLFWELWRGLPEAYVDGVKVEYKVNSVKQIIEDKVTEVEKAIARQFDMQPAYFDNSQEITYSESPRLYWDDEDYTYGSHGLGPYKWFHSKGPYDEDRRQYECVLFYVDGLYREEVVFEIEYEMYNAALRYGDCSELYLATYSGETINHLESFKGQILVPEDKMPKEGNYEAHTYGTNAGNFSLVESTTKNPSYYTFSFELDETKLQFKPYNEYIEFTLIAHGEDKHSFTQYASINDYYNDDVLEELRQEHIKYETLPQTFSFIKTVVVAISIVITILIMGIILGTNKRTRKKYKFYEPTAQMEYFRDIPSDLDPNFAAKLVFCKGRDKDDIKDGYSAVMLNLARKGYIDLERVNSTGYWDSPNVKITIKNRPKRPQEVLAQQQLYIKQQQEFLDKQQMIFSQQQAELNQQKLANKEQEELNRLQTDLNRQREEVNRQQEALNNEYQSPILEPLMPTEEQYFNLLLRHASKETITVDEFQKAVSTDYENTTSFVKKIKKIITDIGTTQGYFQKADYKEPRNRIRGCAILIGIMGVFTVVGGNIISYQTRLELAFGAFFILGIGLIVGAVYLYKVSEQYVLLTHFGEDEYVKWRGLYNFFDSMTLLNERTVLDLQVWEKYLVYATAFGISEKVIKAIGLRCPEASESPVLSNPYYYSHSFYRSGALFGTATRTASFTARSGGHGGYGGGGRGGGGGGGGH